MNLIWSENEKTFIKSNASLLTDEALAIEITKTFGRPVTLQAARKQRQKMKLKKCRGRGICRLVTPDTPPPVPPKPQNGE